MILDYKLSEDIIEYLHSKTKLSKLEIRSVHFSGYYNNLLTIRIIHTSGRQMSLDMPIGKILKTLRIIRLEELGI